MIDLEEILEAKKIFDENANTYCQCKNSKNPCPKFAEIGLLCKSCYDLIEKGIRCDANPN